MERQRRPLVGLGVIVPIVFLSVMAFFAWRGFRVAVSESDRTLTRKVQQINQFAAQYVAQHAERKLERFFRVVEHEARQRELLGLVKTVQAEWEKRGDRQALIRLPQRQALDRYLKERFLSPDLPRVASWFLCGADGTQFAYVDSNVDQVSPTVGRNYAYRTYFHGGPADLSPGTPAPQVIRRTSLSGLLKSTATNTWKVAVSTPLVDAESGAFMGVVGITFELGRFIRFEETPQGEGERHVVIVDGRPGPFQGMILQHPFFAWLRAQGRRIPDVFSRDPRFRVEVAALRRLRGGLYRDPVGRFEEGKAFDGPWIAAASDVALPAPPSGEGPKRSSGLIVVVQEKHDAVVQPLAQLARHLMREGSLALTFLVGTTLVVWYLVFVRLGALPRQALATGPAWTETGGATPLGDQPTATEPRDG